MKIRLGFVSNSSSSSYTLFDNGVIAEVEVGNYIYVVQSRTKNIVKKHMCWWDEHYDRIAEGHKYIYQFDHVLLKLNLVNNDQD